MVLTLRALLGRITPKVGTFQSDNAGVESTKSGLGSLYIIIMGMPAFRRALMEPWEQDVLNLFRDDGEREHVAAMKRLVTVHLVDSSLRPKWLRG